MTVLYHPEFAQDVRRFAIEYAALSPTLAARFRREVDSALTAVIAHPTGTGHFINTGSLVLRETRRRNLDVFPFFVLYALADDRLIFGSLIPSASDPLTWPDRFK